jgi:hypothetical protein
MTREEAISLLSQVNHILVNSNSWLENTHEPLNIAFDMAIEALEQEPCEDCISRQAVLDIITFEDKWLFDANGHNANTQIAFGGLESRVKALPSVTPQPCEDCISRQAAIKAIEALQLPIMREASTCYQFKFSGMSEAKEAVENLPSVTPQQKARNKG